MLLGAMTGALPCLLLKMPPVCSLWMEHTMAPSHRSTLFQTPRCCAQEHARTTRCGFGTFDSTHARSTCSHGKQAQTRSSPSLCITTTAHQRSSAAPQAAASWHTRWPRARASLSTAKAQKRTATTRSTAQACTPRCRSLPPARASASGLSSATATATAPRHRRQASAMTTMKNPVVAAAAEAARATHNFVCTVCRCERPTCFLSFHQSRETQVRAAMSALNHAHDIFTHTPFSAPAPAPATRVPASSLDTFLRLVYEQYRRKGAKNILLDELLRLLFAPFSPHLTAQKQSKQAQATERSCTAGRCTRCWCTA